MFELAALMLIKDSVESVDEVDSGSDAEYSGILYGTRHRTFIVSCDEIHTTFQ